LINPLALIILILSIVQHDCINFIAQFDRNNCNDDDVNIDDDDDDDDVLVRGNNPSNWNCSDSTNALPAPASFRSNAPRSIVPFNVHGDNNDNDDDDDVFCGDDDDVDDDDDDDDDFFLDDIL
jgi:hypothetical protein